MPISKSGGSCLGFFVVACSALILFCTDMECFAKRSGMVFEGLMYVPVGELAVGLVGATQGR